LPDIEINQRLVSFLIFLPFFFLSLAIHEYSHAFVASKYGDDTAKKQGRLTLNPIKHIDIVGSLVMPFLAFTSGFILIGWAKPIPIDRRNFRDPLKNDLLVSFAGPFSNFILAALFFIALMFAELMAASSSSIIIKVLWMGVVFNVFLFLFNLLPIPPLDGSHILFDLFPNKITAKYLSVGFMGTIILLLFIYSPLWSIFMKALNFVLQIFLVIRG
jgi:Zn-dependent protease